MWPASSTGLNWNGAVQSVGVVNPPSRRLLSLVFEHLNQSHGANKTVQWMLGGRGRRSTMVGCQYWNVMNDQNCFALVVIAHWQQKFVREVGVVGVGWLRLYSDKRLLEISVNLWAVFHFPHCLDSFTNLGKYVNWTINHGFIWIMDLMELVYRIDRWWYGDVVVCRWDFGDTPPGRP